MVLALNPGHPKHRGLLASSLDCVLVFRPKDGAAGSPCCVADQVSVIVGLESRLGWYVNPRLASRKERKGNDLLSGPGPILDVFTSINSRNSPSAQ